MSPANADNRIILTAMSVGENPFKVNFHTHIFTHVIWVFKVYAIEILQQENSHNCPNTKGNQCSHTIHFYIQCLSIYTPYY